MQPLTPHTPQRHNAYIYAVAHAHDVDCRDIIQDGKTFVDIDAGFEVAPGDASGFEVANAHPWGCHWLAFSDGGAAGTALGIAEYPSNKSMSCFLNWISATKSHMKTGKKWNLSRLLCDGARVAATNDADAGCGSGDVLLRRRA